VENVYYLFQRACARPPDTATGTSGSKMSDDEGNSALFWIVAENDCIRSAGFRCTTCFTLVALAQHLSELAVGMSLDAAATITADLLLGLHPEVPAERRGRAGLAVSAFQSAVEAVHHNRGAFV
jgi:NifU-like protein involved in Fe-S cluster formation